MRKDVKAMIMVATLILLFLVTIIRPPDKTPLVAGAEMLKFPPTIPHSLQNRTNCISCHEAEIRPPVTPHPERKNCQQCHVRKQ